MFLKMYGGRYPISLFDKSLKTIIKTATNISLMIELPNSQEVLFTYAFLLSLSSLSPLNRSDIFPQKRLMF